MRVSRPSFSLGLSLPLALGLAGLALALPAAGAGSAFAAGPRARVAVWLVGTRAGMTATRSTARSAT